MGVLVEDHVRIESGVPSSTANESHIHLPAYAICSSEHRCRATNRMTMGTRLDRITTSSEAGEVAVLEVPGPLVESEHEEEVVHVVTEVENVDDLLILAVRLIGVESKRAVFPHATD